MDQTKRILAGLACAVLVGCYSDPNPEPSGSSAEDRPLPTHAGPAVPTMEASAQAPTPDGLLVFLRDGMLVTLDMGTGEETATGITDIAPIALTTDGRALVAAGGPPEDIYTDQIVLQPLSDGEATVLVESVPAGQPGVPSPDGRQLVFSGDGVTLNGLVLIDLVTGEASQLTTDGASTAVWSPDGSRIAYESFDPAAAAADLFVLDVATRITRRLTDDEWEDTPFGWTDDGSVILTTSHRGGDGTKLAVGVWQVDAETGALEGPGPNVGVNDLVLPSPDGRWDARITRRGQLAISHPDGSNSHSIGPTDVSVHLTWSPNSAWLVWTSYDDQLGTTDLYAVHAPDGEPIRLTHTREYESHPVWGPSQHGF